MGVDELSPADVPVEEMIKSFKTRLRGLKPLNPVTLPRVVQIETTNRCNRRCIYCNPQRGYGMAPGYMSEETLTATLKAFNSEPLQRSVHEIRPYVNGDPLMDADRMPHILNRIREAFPRAKTVLYSNGSEYRKAEMFLNPNLDEVHFTVSASKRETYMKIHGGDGFEDAVKTVKMLVRRRRGVYVHFVVCTLNASELPKWRVLFHGVAQRVSPLHVSASQQVSLGLLDAGVNEAVEADVCDVVNLPRSMLCNCWDNQSVSWEGLYMMCPASRYSDNCGSVYELSGEEAFARRLLRGVSSGGCVGCNMVRKT